MLELVAATGITVVVVVVVVVEVGVERGGERKISHRAPMRVGGQMQMGMVVVSKASSSSCALFTHRPPFRQ